MRILHPFEYERPKSLEEALALLKRHGAKAAPLAGGTDLVVNLKHRSMLQLVPGAGSSKARFKAASRVPAMERPEVVVSLADIGILRGLRRQGGALRVGPLATMAELGRSRDLFPQAAALADAAAVMGSPLVRSRATVGGNLANARPAADTAVAALALGARLELAAADGRRWVDAADFFTGPGRTVRRPEELLVAIEIPTGPNQGSAYARLGTRRQLEIALAGAAAWIELSPDRRTIAAVRIALGAVGPTPLLATAAGLAGQPAETEPLAVAAKAARNEAKPIDDFRGSARYRLDLVEVLVRRALERALARAQGKEGTP